MSLNPNTTTQALGSRSVLPPVIPSLSSETFDDGERPQILHPEYIHSAFALELIESVLTNYRQLFRKVSPLYSSETSMPATALKPLSR